MEPQEDPRDIAQPGQWIRASHDADRQAGSLAMLLLACGYADCIDLTTEPVTVEMHPAVAC
jgi:hypothetical protein